MLAKDHLLELEDETETGEDAIDEDLLLSRIFFMGLTAGIIFEKCVKKKVSSLALCKNAEQFVM